MQQTSAFFFASSRLCDFALKTLPRKRSRGVVSAAGFYVGNLAKRLGEVDVSITSNRVRPTSWRREEALSQ